MEKLTVLLLVAFVGVVASLPLGSTELDIDTIPHAEPVEHTIRKRFINPLFSMGTPDSQDIVKMRAKRSYDDCEKLRLCKLHARSGNNFFAAFELYFVNKENARLWDHQARSMADCEQRYGDCED